MHFLLPLSLLMLMSTDVSCLEGGPHNVVGLSHSSVTLRCNRNATGEVRWTYKAPGKENHSEQPIPGHYRLITSSYGEHALILEQLTLSDAGMYVCRSVSNSFEPKAAYVVVVVHRPHCEANAGTSSSLVSGQLVKLSCWVSFSGSLHLNISWQLNGSIVEKNVFEPKLGISAYNLVTTVEARFPRLLPHQCLTSFYSVNTDSDISQHQPDFKEGTCFAPYYTIPVDRTSVSNSRITYTTINYPVNKHTHANGLKTNSPDNHNCPITIGIAIFCFVICLLFGIFIGVLITLLYKSRTIICALERWCQGQACIRCRRMKPSTNTSSSNIAETETPTTTSDPLLASASNRLPQSDSGCVPDLQSHDADDDDDDDDDDYDIEPECSHADKPHDRKPKVSFSLPPENVRPVNNDDQSSDMCQVDLIEPRSIACNESVNSSETGSSSAVTRTPSQVDDPGGD